MFNRNAFTDEQANAALQRNLDDRDRWWFASRARDLAGTVTMGPPAARVEADQFGNEQYIPGPNPTETERLTRQTAPLPD